MTAATLMAAPTAAIPVGIELPGVTLVANVDVLSEGNLCSCAAGDDNPF